MELMKQNVLQRQFSGTPQLQLSELYEAKRFMGTVSGTPRARQNRNFPSVLTLNSRIPAEGCSSTVKEKGRRKKEKERKEDDDDKMMR